MLLPVAQVQLGAIWDLLTSQCDRHPENIFIDEHGNLQYIDNDKALGVVRGGEAGQRRAWLGGGSL